MNPFERCHTVTWALLLLLALFPVVFPVLDVIGIVRSVIPSDHMAACRAPRANAVCERWIGSARREALDWLLITCGRHLRHVLVEYIEHYNLARPHRSLGLRPPQAEEDPGWPTGGVICRSRLGGLLHSRQAA